MGVKVQNNRLEINIKPYTNHANQIAKFVDNKTIDYVDDSEIGSHIISSDIISGMEIYKTEDEENTYVTISGGYFYDSINNKQVLLNKPHKIQVKTSELSESFGIYYTYNDESFIISKSVPKTRYKLLGIFNKYIQQYFPQQDLSDVFAQNFIINENYNSIGYRVRYDGWKEQWGTNANPIFPIAFDEIPVYYTNDATNITKTGMTISEGYWYACGY